MLFFLAEFTPPTEIAVWLGCLAFVLHIFVKIMEAKKLLTPPGAIKVSAEERPVTRAEFEKMEKDVNDVETKIDGVTKSINENHIALLKSIMQQSSDLQTRINGLTLEVERITPYKRKA